MTTTQQEGNRLIADLEMDLELFPLPICFENGEERRELFKRKQKIKSLVEAMTAYQVGNILIDRFMGVATEFEYYITEWTSDRAHNSWWKYSTIMKEDGINMGSANPCDWHCELLEERLSSNSYHSSWSLLMPVVEKICHIEISDQYVRIEIVPGGYVKIENLRDTPIFTNVSIEGSLIAAIWKTVVQFIQWHTKNKQP